MVDDNVDIRNYVAQIFEKDFQVFALSGKYGAERLLTDIDPQVTRRDAMKRELSELELSSSMRYNSSWNNTPVILVIANSSQEIELSGLNVAAENYVAKPFDKELLLAHVHSLIQNQQHASEHLYENRAAPHTAPKMTTQHHDFIEKVTQIVEEHLDDPKLNVQMLAEATSMSHSNFYRRIKSISGKSANEYIRLIRLRRVARLLIETEYNVSEAAFAAGFNDIKYFRAKFLKLYGMKPSEYKKKYELLKKEQQYAHES